MERTIKIITKQDPHDPAVQAALTYLTTWSPNSYDTLSIYDDGGTEGKDMIAHYQDSKQPGQYVIGAIWEDHKQKYGMHS